MPKSYTDIEQSKKLAEILPTKSADMCFYYKDDIPQLVPFSKHNNRFYIPCWSLVALLSVYPMVVGRDMDMYCCWQNSKNLHSRHYDNPIDACYEMIIKLNKIGVLWKK